MPERRSPLDVPDSLDDDTADATEDVGEAPGARSPEDGSLRGRATDFMRKALVAGVGALFLTEEGIRNLVGELKLPKELIGALLAQADRTKQDLVRILGEELRHFFESAQLHEEILKLLTHVTIEVKTEIKLHPENGAIRTEVVGDPQIGVRRRRKEK